MIDSMAGEPPQDKTNKAKAGTIDPESFKEFQQDMGTEITDNVNMDELIKRYAAWQLFMQVYKDPTIVKAEIIKKFQVTTAKKTYGGNDSSSSCSFCKKPGHSY